MYADLLKAFGEVAGLVVLGFIGLFLVLVLFSFLIWSIDRLVDWIRETLYERRILKTSKEVYSFGFNIPDDRLYEILDCVYRTEFLPELTCAEEDELVRGRNKLLTDCGRPYLQHYWWLTEQGDYILKKLRCM